MDKLKTCIASLRVLTRHQDFNRQVVVEKLINDFLREDDSSTLSASLKRIGEAIDAEANKNVLGEDWTIMQSYVRWCHETLRRPTKETPTW
jgi:hypothetical protein